MTPVERKQSCPGNTIVTACNSSYFWGAFLLTASIRFSQGQLPIIIVTHGMTDREKSLLGQFEGVCVHESAKPLPHLAKADALELADTEYVTWLDADCLYVGNIDSLLIPGHGNFQIRFRAPGENQSVFRRRMSGSDAFGSVPASVMATWCKDVDQRAYPRPYTQCVTNAFCFHRNHMPFIRAWRDQINKVATDSQNTTDPSSHAYFMSDESVMASLMCFAHDIPTLTPYKLDDTNSAHLMHFGRTPKPWNGWRLQHLSYYNHVQKILLWAASAGYTLPAIPTSMTPVFRPLSHFAAWGQYAMEKSKSGLSNTVLPLISAK